MNYSIVRNDPNYEEPLDPSIIPLCDVLNDAGFPTIESCCGHGINRPAVYFEKCDDKRIESLARFIMARENGNYRAHFTVVKKIFVPSPHMYHWELVIHLNNLYADTSREKGMRIAKIALAKVTKAVCDWRRLEKRKEEK